MKSLHMHLLEQRLDDLKPLEVWRQDSGDPELWHHANGLIINTAALVERETYFNIVRIRATDPQWGSEPQHLDLAPEA